MLTGIDEAEVARRKEFLELSEADVALITKLHVHLNSRRNAFVASFYDHLLRFPEVATVLGDRERVDALMRAQVAYLTKLTEGNYDSHYVEERLRVGLVHQQLGVAPKWYMGAYRKYLGELIPSIFELLDGDIEACIATCNALAKVIFLDMGLALDTYFFAEQQEVLLAKRYSEQIITELPVGLMVLDSELRVSAQNQVMRNMLHNDTADSSVGQTVNELFHDAGLTSMLVDVLQRKTMRMGLTLVRATVGGDKFFIANASSIPHPTGDDTQILLVIQDITAHKAAEERTRYLEQYDALTGLANRTLLVDRINYAYSLLKREVGTLQVMMIDIDRFSVINDSIGSGNGDRLLIEIAKRLKGALRESDTLGRISGDEFVLVLCNLSANDDARVVARKIQEILAVPFLIDGRQLRLTASIGIAVASTDGEDAAELIGNAATALHRAQKDSRNQYCFYQAEMNLHVQAEMQIESGLYRAIEERQFVLYYQPKVDLRTKGISGLEVLLRWKDPDRGLVAPSEFIPVLESTGLIVQVGEWILHTACKQAKTWLNMGIKSCRVAVNLSAVQFHRQDIVGVVRRALSEADLESSYLELEVTESTIMKDMVAAVDTLRDLRALGVSISIDDFGTGQSSLNYLKRFSANALKIDQSFVREIVTNSEDALISRAIIDLAHNLDMKVIAEGVETEGQLAFMYRNHCDEIQGYLYSKPLAVDDCTASLLEGRLLRREGSDANRTLLLIDDEEGILSSLRRLLRNDGYTILTANSAQQGFEILSKHSVGVIVSDHRMPGMTGAEFLGKIKEIYPDTIRIVLSGYADFQFITDAINRGSIYKFLTKPWDDDLLREHIKKAFELFQLLREKSNLTVQLKDANQQLEIANRKLEEGIGIKSMEATRNSQYLQVSQEVLEQLPIGVIGVGDDGLIAVANNVANQIFAHSGDGPLQGSFAVERLPNEIQPCLTGSCAHTHYELEIANGNKLELWCHRLGKQSPAKGTVIAVSRRL
jgi:diguanylate cyclase (GGDEF)-like protein